MPQGKGTYGSKVGRPPKKKYQTGGSIDPFSTRNPEGIPAKMDMEAIEEQDNLPTSNAMERSEVSPMGAEVGTGVYKEGGEVKEPPMSENVDKVKIETLKNVAKEVGYILFPAVSSSVLRASLKKSKKQKALKQYKEGKPKAAKGQLSAKSPKKGKKK